FGQLAADDLQALLVLDDLLERLPDGVYALLHAEHRAGLRVHLPDALVLVDQDQARRQAFEGMDEFLPLLIDLLERLRVGDDRRRVAGEAFEQPHVFLDELAAIAFVEAVEDADHDAVYDAVLVVALLDEEGNGDAVADAKLAEEVFFLRENLVGVVKDDRFSGAEHGTGEAGVHVYPELLHLVFADAKSRRACDEVFGIPVADHDDALLGLKDHGDTLDEAFEGLLEFGDGNRRIADHLRHGARLVALHLINLLPGCQKLLTRLGQLFLKLLYLLLQTSLVIHCHLPCSP